MSINRREQTAPDPDWPRSTRLWLVTDRMAAAPRTLAETTALAIAGGVDAVLFRMKDEADYGRLRAEAEAVQAVCTAAAVPFVVSHNLQLALELGADGLQLGIADPPPETVRREWGRALGYSAHATEEARVVLSGAANYAFLGPVFSTPSKAGLGQPLGLETVSQAVALNLPLVYIGGIDSHCLPELLAAGAGRIAVIRAIQSADNPQQAASELLKLLTA